MRAYATLGGVPAYLEKFDADTGLFDNIEKHVLTKGSFLHEEPEFLLRQELREPLTYMSILESMALGSTTVTEVANDMEKRQRSVAVPKEPEGARYSGEGNARHGGRVF